MKILVATPTFPPDLNGVAEASAACARALQLRGSHVEVVTSKASTSSHSFQWEGITVHEFAITGTPHFRHYYQGPMDSYCNFLQSRHWDVILFQGYSWPLDLAVPFFDHIPAKKVLVSHGYGALVWTPVPRFPFGLGALTYSVIRSLKMLCWIRKIDRWVFLSPRTDFRSFYDHWLAQKMQHPGVRVIPNGLDPSQRGVRSRFREAFGIPADVLVFLCVGYFSRGKNQKMALQAYRQAALPNSRLVFIAPECNAWMERCQEADLSLPSPAANSGVLWLTKLSREMTLDSFSASDIYLSSSLGETQPISILEAMRECKPWIALRAGCISEFPGGSCVSSLQEMVLAIRRLGTESEECKTLGQAGRQAVESKYSMDRFDSAYCELVEQLMSEGS
jgi:glycosyltransferase involved in cell wall biosynthesis